MFESRRAKTSVILVGIALTAAIVLAIAQPLFTTASTTHTQSSGFVQTSQAVIRGPPAPLPLIMWGQQDSLEHAKNVTGMSWVSLPTQVPSNLNLSIRVRNDESSISAIYTPLGVTVSDNDTNEKVASAGGFSILYLKQVGGPTFNMTANMVDISKQQPNTYLDTINGYQALITPHEIQINAGNCMGKTNCWLLIIIGSERYNSTDLRPIAESIAILSHD